jgi:hypothetical protein
MAAVLVLLLLTGTALASDGGPSIVRYVIGGGGGYSETGPFVLDATAGQAVAGIVNTPHLEGLRGTLVSCDLLTTAPTCARMSV